MTRIEHYEDPDAPSANSLVPAASAVVSNEKGEILLTKRSDNGLWTIPGGAMEPGECIADTAVREVEEETGLEVRVTRLVGIYSNPRHVIEYADGEVRQQFSVCFAAEPVGGFLRPSSETSEVSFVAPAALEQLSIHPSIRLRVEHFLQGRLDPYIGGSS